MTWINYILQINFLILSFVTLKVSEISLSQAVNWCLKVKSEKLSLLIKKKTKSENSKNISAYT